MRKLQLHERMQLAAELQEQCSSPHTMTNPSQIPEDEAGRSFPPQSTLVAIV